MKVVAAKISSNNTKFAYFKEDNPKLFIRSQNDKFSVGKLANCDVISLIGRWGFRRVENPPDLKDSKDMLDNVDNFEITNKGSIKYSGFQL